MKVYYNGKIWTDEGEYTWIAVNELGVIENIGSGEPPIADANIDLKGRRILPGLHDSHIHVYSLGRSEFRLNLLNVQSIAELQTHLLDYATQHKELEWIVGFGWDQDQFTEQRYPNRADLDAVVPDKPVVLFRACHHIGVINSKAMKLLGITAETQDPFGGQIDRDEEGPTGILREEALKFVTPFIEKQDDANRLEYFRRGLESCLKVGLTGVQTNDPKAWEAYKQLVDKGEMKIRTFLTLTYNDFVNDEKRPAPLETYGLLEAHRVKLFADGSLGASTAALNEPYSDNSASDPERRGILIHTDEELLEKMKLIAEAGFVIETHAIGDRAAEQVLHTYDKLGLKHQILTHCQILSRDAIEMMKATQTIANIQPVFVFTDSLWAEKRVGSRIKYSYAWKTLLEEGIVCAGGSDAPIENNNPLFGIYEAMFRRSKAFPQGWLMLEALTFEEAMSLFTINAAKAVGKEEILGRLAPGYLADFIVLDTDVVEDPKQLPIARVEEVYIAGAKVYDLHET